MVKRYDGNVFPMQKSSIELAALVGIAPPRCVWPKSYGPSYYLNERSNYPLRVEASIAP